MLSYRKLNIWLLAKELCINVYKVTDTFPDKERFGLTSQINRAVISVASNIAEGSSRSSKKDQIRFIEIAYGSLMETACQLEISKDLGYLDEERFDFIEKKIVELSIKISNYKKVLESKTAEHS